MIFKRKKNSNQRMNVNPPDLGFIVKTPKAGEVVGGLGGDSHKRRASPWGNALLNSTRREGISSRHEE